MNQKTLMVFVASMALLSCTSNISSIKDSKKIHDTLSCWSSFDTIFKNGDYIKYIKIDTTTDIQVKIKDKVTSLGWNLVCDMPAGLIPTIYSHTENLILLIRGYSNTFREVIVCEYLSDSISIHRYETELSFQGDSDIADQVVYKLIADNSTLYLSNRLADDHNEYTTKALTLPEKFVRRTIDKATISKDKITLSFTDKTKVNLPIPEN